MEGDRHGQKFAAHVLGFDMHFKLGVVQNGFNFDVGLREPMAAKVAGMEIRRDAGFVRAVMLMHIAELRPHQQP